MSEIDYYARQCYLVAIQRIWSPRPLSALPVADVTTWIKTIGRIWPVWWDELTQDASAAASVAKSALLGWRAKYPIAAADTWIMDAALQSIGHYLTPILARSQATKAWTATTRQQLEWSYTARAAEGGHRNLNRVAFDLQISDKWSGDEEAGKRAPQEWHNLLDRKWREACKPIRAALGTKREDKDYRLDAEWTARRLAGEAGTDIARRPDLDDPTRRQVDADTVSKRVHEFRKRAAIVLPPRLTLGESLGSSGKEQAKTGKKRP